MTRRLLLAALIAPLVVGLGSAGARAQAPVKLSANAGLRVDGSLWRQHLGNHVAAAGDFNGDGLADLLVTTQESHSSRHPVWNAYVVLGRRGGVGRKVSTARLRAGGIVRLVSSDALEVGAAAGDVNGDGRADVALATSGATRSRRVDVVFGSRSRRTVNLDRLGRRGIVVLDRSHPGQELGAALAPAGDLDGDHLGDVLIGAPAYRAGTSSDAVGRVYALLGRRRSGTIDIAHPGRALWTVQGPPAAAGQPATGFGAAVAGPATPTATAVPTWRSALRTSRSATARVYVVLARPVPGGVLDLGAGPGAWYRVDGPPSSDLAGWALAPAGDQNGDGLADLLVGEHAGGQALTSSYGVGAAYVLYGRRGREDASLADLGTGGYALRSSVPGDRLGFAVATAGDADGDGRADLLLGAPLAGDATRAAGAAYLVSGGPRTGTIAPQALPAPEAIAYGGTSRYETAGWSVAGLGDFNGDRRPDVAISAPRVDVGSHQNAGSVFIVYSARRP